MQADRQKKLLFWRYWVETVPFVADAHIKHRLPSQRHGTIKDANLAHVSGCDTKFKIVLKNCHGELEFVDVTRIGFKLVGLHEWKRLMNLCYKLTSISDSIKVKYTKCLIHPKWGYKKRAAWSLLTSFKLSSARSWFTCQWSHKLNKVTDIFASYIDKSIKFI
jgi:hypothetical protein